MSSARPPWGSLASASLVRLVAPGHAGSRLSLRVAGDERACPAPSQVAAVLAPLLRGTKVAGGAGSPGPDDALVSDDGSKFRVAVASREREFNDAERDCTERARQAAVFIALVLDPPLVADRSMAEPQPEKPAPIVASPRPRPGPNLDLDLGSFFQSAPGASDRIAALPGGL